MDVRELRIGNYYKSTSSYSERVPYGIFKLNETTLYWIMELIMFDDIYPVEVTESRLLDLGFQQRKDYPNYFHIVIHHYILEGLYAIGYNLKAQNVMIGDKTLGGEKKTYVHQVQDFYRIFTGKELELNSK